jgi:hypothetical protein
MTTTASRHAWRFDRAASSFDCLATTCGDSSAAKVSLASLMICRIRLALKMERAHHPVFRMMALVVIFIGGKRPMSSGLELRARAPRVSGDRQPHCGLHADEILRGYASPAR